MPAWDQNSRDDSGYRRTFGGENIGSAWCRPVMDHMPFVARPTDIDRDFGREKRTAQVDVERDKDKLLSLLEDADVFIQGFRPSSLASKGLLNYVLVRTSRAGIFVANMSAYGLDGPWSGRRGFDSLLQTCSGVNVFKAEHFGAGEVARPTPCQALDHAGGYFLAA